MIFHDCEQYSDEWWTLRAGMPTASGIHKIITPKTGKYSASADKYIAQLIDEKISGFTERYMSEWMQRGLNMEPEAVSWYQFHTDLIVQPCGLITPDDLSCGVSPDGIIEGGGRLEVKAPKGSTHVEWFLAGGLPDEHKVQCHASLHISEARWLDFVSYHPLYKPILIRVIPDKYTKMVGARLQEFVDNLAEAKEKILR